MARGKWRHSSVHFGNDASVDSAAAAEISIFLELNAGRDRGNAIVGVRASAHHQH
jgi:hypothetical protein